jgi:predicted metalloprotease with PDZ domain
LEFDVEARTPRDESPRRWVVQKAWAGETAVLSRIGAVRAECDGRATPVDREDLETHVGWTFADRCASTTFHYRVDASPRGVSWGNEYDSVVTPTFASAIAETALLLPDVPDDTRARIEVFFDLSDMPGAEGIYSLGPRVRSTTTRALRHAYFAMGHFVTMYAEAPPLKLEIRYAGDMHFDVFSATRDLRKLLDAEASMFEGDRGDVIRMLVVGMPPANGMSHGTSLTESAAIWIDGREKWSQDDARLAAHEMFHLYNGQIVRRTGPDERTYWLSEGFTEHYTDELMLRAATCSPEEWFESLRYRVRAYHTHRDVEMPNDRAELGWGGADAQLPYLRGSMIAAYVDWAMRKHTKNKRTLDDFMRHLVERARAGEPPLDQDKIFELLRDAIGDEALRVVKEVAIDGQRMVLPPDAYGSCVEVVGTGQDTDLRIKPGVDLEACVRAGR